MNSLDRRSSLFWLLLSILMSIESLRLGIGTLQKPGMGFLSFWASVLFGILSLILFIQSSVKKEHGQIKAAVLGPQWKRIVVILIALLVYSRWMPVLGYLIATFLLMSLLFWIVRGQGWHKIILFSFSATLITYYVFAKLLRTQLPTGLLGF